MEYIKDDKVADCGSVLHGAIFLTNCAFRTECFKRRLFGLPRSKISLVKKIKSGTTLFLFDFDERNLYGVYAATCNGALDIDPCAFTSSEKSLSAQIRFKIISSPPPLPENEFKEVIQANYYAPKKFHLNLSREQVVKLVALFHACWTKIQRPLRSRSSRKSIKKSKSSVLDGNIRVTIENDTDHIVMNDIDMVADMSSYPDPYRTSLNHYRLHGKSKLNMSYLTGDRNVPTSSTRAYDLRVSESLPTTSFEDDSLNLHASSGQGRPCKFSALRYEHKPPLSLSANDTTWSMQCTNAYPMGLTESSFLCSSKLPFSSRADDNTWSMQCTDVRLMGLTEGSFHCSRKPPLSSVDDMPQPMQYASAYPVGIAEISFPSSGISPHSSSADINQLSMQNTNPHSRSIKGSSFPCSRKLWYKHLIDPDALQASSPDFYISDYEISTFPECHALSSACTPMCRCHDQKTIVSTNIEEDEGLPLYDQYDRQISFGRRAIRDSLQCSSGNDLHCLQGNRYNAVPLCGVCSEVMEDCCHEPSVATIPLSRADGYVRIVDHSKFSSNPEILYHGYEGFNFCHPEFQDDCYKNALDSSLRPGTSSKKASIFSRLSVHEAKVKIQDDDLECGEDLCPSLPMDQFQRKQGRKHGVVKKSKSYNMKNSSNHVESTDDVYVTAAYASENKEEDDCGTKDVGLPFPNFKRRNQKIASETETQAFVDGVSSGKRRKLNRPSFSKEPSSVEGIAKYNNVKGPSQVLCESSESVRKVIPKKDKGSREELIRPSFCKERSSVEAIANYDNVKGPSQELDGSSEPVGKVMPKKDKGSREVLIRPSFCEEPSLVEGIAKYDKGPSRALCGSSEPVSEVIPKKGEGSQEQLIRPPFVESSFVEGNAEYDNVKGPSQELCGSSDPISKVISKTNKGNREQLNRISFCKEPFSMEGIAKDDNVKGPSQEPCRTSQ